MNDDFAQEFAAMNVEQAVEALARRGVCRWDLYDFCGGARVGRVTIEGRHFTPDPEGTPMIVMPVCYDAASLDYDQDISEISDFICFHPDFPKKWYFRIGEAVAILGHGNLPRFKLAQDAGDTSPLPVHQTPLDWLRNAGKGVCCLNKRSMRELLGLKFVETSSQELAHVLKIELNKPNPQIPRIAVIPRDGAAAGEVPPSSAPAAATPPDRW